MARYDRLDSPVEYLSVVAFEHVGALLMHNLKLKNGSTI
jgi:hypothetical protein